MKRGPALRAGGVLGACLFLTAALTAPAFAAPVAPGAPASAGRTGSEPAGLPGPVGGCPSTQGISAPAGTPWAQQALSFPASGR